MGLVGVCGLEELGTAEIVLCGEGEIACPGLACVLEGSCFGFFGLYDRYVQHYEVFMCLISANCKHSRRLMSGYTG